MHKLGALFLFLVAAASAGAQSEGYRFPVGGRQIMATTVGRKMLHVCARSAPKEVTTFWMPRDSDIDNLETKLPIYLAKLEKAESVRPDAGSYNRQYLGIVRKGIHLIYGNFYPSPLGELASTDSEKSRPVDACGGALWGIVFNPKTGVLTDLSINRGF